MYGLQQWEKTNSIYSVWQAITGPSMKKCETIQVRKTAVWFFLNNQKQILQASINDNHWIAGPWQVDIEYRGPGWTYACLGLLNLEQWCNSNP